MANTYRELLAALVSLPDAALDSPIVVSEDEMNNYYAASFSLYAPSVIYDDDEDGPVLPVIGYLVEDALYDEDEDEVMSDSE